MLTKIAVTLTPVVDQVAPMVTVSVPGQTISIILSTTQCIELEFDSTMGWLEVEFMSKPDNDYIMAVIVDKIEFFSISDPRFAWAGVYTPDYPEPWFSQQAIPPQAHLPGQTYLGWNGVWRLDFTVPVFTWMHQQLNLGWLYQ